MICYAKTFIADGEKSVNNAEIREAYEKDRLYTYHPGLYLALRL